MKTNKTALISALIVFLIATVAIAAPALFNITQQDKPFTVLVWLLSIAGVLVAVSKK